VTGPIHGFNAGQKIGPVQPGLFLPQHVGYGFGLENEPAGYKVQRSLSAVW